MIGTGIGGLGGAGVGFLSAEKDDPNRLRKTLVGGATGAALGGLTGALSGSGLSKLQAEKLMAEAEVNTAKQVDEALNVGYRAAVRDMGAKPQMVNDILDKMSPEARKIVLDKYNKGWLTRMFGG